MSGGGAEALFANSAKTPLDLTEADISALFTPLDQVVEQGAMGAPIDDDHLFQFDGDHPFQLKTTTRS
jgi:hypothetical protein